MVRKSVDIKSSFPRYFFGLAQFFHYLFIFFFIFFYIFGLGSYIWVVKPSHFHCFFLRTIKKELWRFPFTISKHFFPSKCVFANHTLDIFFPYFFIERICLFGKYDEKTNAYLVRRKRVHIVQSKGFITENSTLCKGTGAGLLPGAITIIC